MIVRILANFKGMDFNEEHYLPRIRQKLQENGVKLWLAPYYADQATNKEKLEV